jgi:LPS export ABC transporter protein LptC
MLFRIFTVLAVVALVISTWILSSPAKRPQPVSIVGKADLPGYYLKNTVLTDYDENGVPTIRIEAERIDQIAHTPEVVLNNVRVNYLSQN